MKTISATQLTQALALEQGPLLLDVRLPEDFAASHLPDSVSNSVFEVVFTSRLETTAPDRSRPVVLVGADGTSREAAMAAEKLERLGYSDVALLEGGIAAWTAAGLPLQGDAPAPSPTSLPDGRKSIDVAESRVEWLGRNLVNKHWGTIPVTDGHLDFANGELVGGEFSLDLKAIACTDLAGTPYHDVLIAHLHDHDFFDLSHHPEVRLVIRNAEQIPGSTSGSPNLRVTADLTMRGQTHPITFDAAAGVTAEGKAAAQAAFSIDRTRWGVLYGSGKFFTRLAGHLVNDLIEFQVRILTC